MAPLEHSAAVARLDSLYECFESLSAKSSGADLEKLISFFTDDCDCNIRSMREFPTIGKQALLDDAKDLFQSYRLLSCTVESQAVSQDGDSTVVFCQMSNRIDILGDIIDPFQEIAVVTFDGDKGFISKFKLYSCRSPLVRLLQEKTHLGPYSDEYMATDEQLPGMQKEPQQPASCH